MSNTTGYQHTPPDLSLINSFIALALAEDVGGGDHTSLSTIPTAAIDRAHLEVKAEVVLAGVELTQIIFSCVDPSLKTEIFVEDGTFVKKGDIAFIVEG